MLRSIVAIAFRLRVLLLLWGVLSPAAAWACGGNGERACCLTDGAPACDGGNVPAEGCVGSLGDGPCTCGGFNPFGLVKALNVCRAPTCGGGGQRGCCVGAERDAKGLSNPTRPCSGAG